MTDNLRDHDVPESDPAMAPRKRWLTKPFVRHFLEMVVAMIAGMMLLAPVWEGIYGLFGGPGVFGRPDVGALVMATNMTIGMSAWMLYRGHNWAAIAEMGAAMFVPFLLLFPPFWAGWLSGDALVLGGHVLMIPAMIVAMLVRRAEYSHGHHGHQHQWPAIATAGTTALRIARRWWPAAAGLAVGIVGLLDIQPWTPSELTNWLLPVIASVYLIFGAVRGRLRQPGVLATQTVGLVIFSVLALAALVLDPVAGHYVVAAGWFGHAIWDVAHHGDLNHHRNVGVVPRGYAEYCIALDLLIGASLVVAPVL